ncbi:hypothetical protein FF011L_32660 [Roseimaritima multifibrata]|uniref:Uncharacterized protein n=1 Tax=Roseimaritima multifibrata TaxID=1930274 RepID=A0A517MI71_9BACT|nr:hypothetical protein FF011L_32660 [Roseimaritima multifibrata]
MFNHEFVVTLESRLVQLRDQTKRSLSYRHLNQPID